MSTLAGTFRAFLCERDRKHGKKQQPKRSPEMIRYTNATQVDAHLPHAFAERVPGYGQLLRAG